MTPFTLNSTGSTGDTFPREIEAMFSAIVPWYDFLNRFLSLGRDRYWRKTAVDALKPFAGQKVLDLATGTADVALEIASRFVPGQIKVCGADFSKMMLYKGVEKASQAGLNRSLAFIVANGEALPFSNNSFEGATIAFGIRNFVNVERGLDELYRTLAPGYCLSILEFSRPRHSLFSWVYFFYFQYILPWIGRRISGHRTAYQYLTESVSAFPEKEDFVKILGQVGFDRITVQDLTSGIVTLYVGYKK